MTSPRHFIWLCFTIYFLTSLTLTEPSSSDRTQINLKPAVHQKPNSKIDSRIDPNRFPRSTLAFSPSSSARSPLPLFPTLSSLFLSSSAPALPAHVPIRLLRLLFYQGETRVLPNVASLVPPHPSRRYVDRRSSMEPRRHHSKNGLSYSNLFNLEVILTNSFSFLFASFF